MMAIMAERLYREPTEAEKAKLYELYLQVFNSNFSLSKKRSVITAVLGYEVWSWRVTGISHNALLAIKFNNYRYPKNTLVRDHNPPRSVTYKKTFGEMPLDFHDWWNTVWNGDATTLITHGEHNKPCTLSKIYPVDVNQGLFMDKEVAGFYYTMAREGAFVQHICETENI